MIDIIKEKSKSGYNTYRYNKKYIYSAYDPLNEAKKFIKNQKSINNTVITICGADYINLLLTEEKNIDMIISYEPIEFEKLSESKKIIRVNKIDILENILFEKKIKLNNITLLFWQPLIENLSDDYLPCLKEIKNILNKLSLSNTAASTFGFLETKNFLLNILKLDGIDILKKQNTLKKNPALLLSSGASLAEKLDFIQKIKNKAVIFALPSALSFLDYHGIKPDFAVAVDPGYAAFHHLKNYKKPLKLITTLNITPSIMNLKNYNFIYFNYNNFFENILYSGSDAVSSASEGSVFLNSLRILPQLGFTDVCIAGQDFGFYKNRTHVKEGFFEKEFLYKSSFHNTFEKLFIENYYLYKKETIAIKDKTINTNPALKVYYEHFIKEQFNINITLPENPFNILSERFKKISISFFDNYPVKNININEYAESGNKIFIEQAKRNIFNEINKIYDKIEKNKIDNLYSEDLLNRSFIEVNNLKHISKLKKILRVLN